VSSSGHTTTRTTHGSQVWSSDGQTGTRQIEWLHTLVVDGGQLITVGSSSTTEAWSPGSNVTITGVGASGQPTAPTYTGLDDQHFDDLVAALLAHAQDLADQAQNSTLTTASRAALVDAAIASFNALDADENGENGGAVYQYCAAPPADGGEGSDDEDVPLGPHGTGRIFQFKGGHQQFITGKIHPDVLRDIKAGQGQDKVIGVSGLHVERAQPAPPKPPMTWGGFLDTLQGALDAFGVADPTPICDGINALISLLRGNGTDAACSVAAMFPYLGDVAKLGKYGKKVADAAHDAMKWLGADFIIKRSDDVGFVAMSKEGKRRLRMDFEGHGFAPHGHLEVWDESTKRFRDAIPGEHHLPFHP